MRTRLSLFFLTLLLFKTLSASDETSVITNPVRADGFGSQFQSIIYAAIYAELNNKDYLYSPFISMEHNYSNDPNFIEKKEVLINFIGSFRINTDMVLQRSMSIQPFQVFFDQNIESCVNSNALKRIKEVFRLNKDPHSYFDDNYLNIAVHIRRPNSHDSRSVGTDAPDDIYLKIINYLRDFYCLKNPLFHIYSQGDVGIFEKIYKCSDVVFHINETIEDTFSSMVFADALVIGSSSLSYVAGILSEGTVYYVPFWHPPLPNWIVLDEK
jgi:hypothetical protein